MLTSLLNVLAWKRCTFFFPRKISRDTLLKKIGWRAQLPAAVVAGNLERQLDLNLLPTASLLVTSLRHNVHPIELTPLGLKKVFTCVAEVLVS